MIQRIQTLWLLAAALCGFATLKMPYYVGSTGNGPAVAFTAMSHVLLMILTVATAIIALVAIFLYKNRPFQTKITLAGLGISILNIVLYVLYTKDYDSGAMALSSVFTFAVTAFFIMALMGIRKDEKLVKSLDRLR
jgi:uncharacterized membrane protein